VNVFTGLLSQVRLGGKWRRAQRASALNHGLSAVMRRQTIGGSIGRVGDQRSRAGPSVKPALTGQAQGRERLHRASLSQVRLDEKWRRAQRASALNHGLSAIMRPQAIGDSTGRVAQTSRCGGHGAVAWHGAQGRLRDCRDHRNPGSSQKPHASQVAKGLWSGRKIGKKPSR
jgi:hypothetical protein